MLGRFVFECGVCLLLSFTGREGGASLNSASGSEDSNWSSSSDEESEALYHKRYVFTKKMAKGIIYVSSQPSYSTQSFLVYSVRVNTFCVCVCVCVCVCAG